VGGLENGVDETGKLFERGIAILSFDTEQIWGHADYFNEAQFLQRYLARSRRTTGCSMGLCAADIPATWFLVGGMALSGSKGSQDGRNGRPARRVDQQSAGPEARGQRPSGTATPSLSRLKGANPHQENRAARRVDASHLDRFRASRGTSPGENWPRVSGRSMSLAYPRVRSPFRGKRERFYDFAAATWH